MSLLDDIAADSRRTIGCSVCDWIAARPPEEARDVWDVAMAGSTKQYGHAAIHRAMKKLGYLHSSKPIEEHRRNAHRQPTD